MSKFQVRIGGKWEGYSDNDNAHLKMAYCSGHPTAQISLGQTPYEINFENMTQINLQTGTCREIRPPYKMGRPSKPVVPQGETVMVRVPMDAPKDAIFQIEHPSGRGTINVKLPPGTQPGALMMVPVPPVKGDNHPSRPSNQSEKGKGRGGEKNGKGRYSKGGEGRHSKGGEGRHSKGDAQNHRAPEPDPSTFAGNSPFVIANAGDGSPSIVATGAPVHGQPVAYSPNMCGAHQEIIQGVPSPATQAQTETMVFEGAPRGAFNPACAAHNMTPQADFNPAYATTSPGDNIIHASPPSQHAHAHAQKPTPPQVPEAHAPQSFRHQGDFNPAQHATGPGDFTRSSLQHAQPQQQVPEAHAQHKNHAHLEHFNNPAFMNPSNHPQSELKQPQPHGGNPGTYEYQQLSGPGMNTNPLQLPNPAYQQAHFMPMPDIGDLYPGGSPPKGRSPYGFNDQFSMGMKNIPPPTTGGGDSTVTGVAIQQGTLDENDIKQLFPDDLTTPPTGFGQLGQSVGLRLQ